MGAPAEDAPSDRPFCTYTESDDRAGNKNKNGCSFETAGEGKRGGVGWGRVERMGGGGGGRSKVVEEGG